MEFSEQIIKILDKLNDKIGMTIDWSNTNVIPYLQTLTTKYIDYEIATSVFWIIICVIGVILGILLIYMDLKYDNGLIVPGLCITILSFSCILIQSKDVITAKIFPEKIVIDYLLEIKNNI